VLVQAPIWAAVWLYGLRIAHAMEPQSGPGNRQFGIRQLMTLTAIIGVLLGLGRLVLTRVTWLDDNRNWLEDFLIFGFIGVANALIAFPILAAALLPRFARLASIGILVLVAALIVVEVPLFDAVTIGGGPHDWWIFGGMNFGYCLWVLAYVGVLRLGGYRLVSR
jgi:hypothetical protein